jgi:HSP20 family protein
MFGTLRNGYPGLGQLRTEVDRLFSDLFNPASRPTVRAAWGNETPALNVWDDEANYYAEAELPGYKMDEIEILVVKNELTLKGERKEGEAKDVTFHRRERGEGVFSRVLRLPAEVDSEKVHASLKDGVLTITLPKAEETKPRKIPVAVR